MFLHRSLPLLNRLNIIFNALNSDIFMANFERKWHSYANNSSICNRVWPHFVKRFLLRVAWSIRTQDQHWTRSRAKPSIQNEAKVELSGCWYFFANGMMYWCCTDAGGKIHTSNTHTQTIQYDRGASTWMVCAGELKSSENRRRFSFFLLHTHWIRIFIL